MSDEPGKTNVGPGETRVNGNGEPEGPGKTRVSPGKTRVSGPQSTSGTRTGSTFIPESLEDQFELIRRLPPGRQAVPLVVRRRDNGELRVLKLYETGVPKGFLRVLERLVGGSSEQDAHLVRIYDFGTYDGEFGEAVWEEQEYCESGSLEEMLSEGSLQNDFDLFSEVVREVSNSI